ncbi:MAG TPA: glycosyltransferase family 39 protein [Bryobacteraceae bacterium]|nr:glycosyltransferase family 39 protein [Bryobacteraceae bacterium]
MKTSRSGGVAIAAAIALATVIAHILTGAGYGFHRDELATLDDARHLAWGYVAYPPMTPFFGRISLDLFGESLRGFRFFAALADAAAVFITGLMARGMGGGRFAQMLAALASLPFSIGAGALMQYVSFDYLCWVLTAYFTVRALASEDARWWMAAGAAIGFGMLSKYSIPFFAAGLIAGLLFTEARRYLRSKWLWIGAAIALIVFLPNLIWQARNHFIYLDFVRHIHARDVAIGRARGFLPGQIKLTLFALPAWIAGLWFCWRSGRFRPIAWMYIVPLALFLIAQGRDYYLAGAYPMLYAAGAVYLETWRPLMMRGWAQWVAALILVADAAIAASFTLPVAPVNSGWFKIASRVNGDFLEEIGWPDLVQTIAGIRDSLSAGDREHLGILVGNYGEAGAIDLYGPHFGLPKAISGVNSFWARGYGDPPPEVLIVAGFSRAFAERNFESCQVAANTWNRFGVRNEETVDHPDIFVCRGLKLSWPEFWKHVRHFG